MGCDLILLAEDDPGHAELALRAFKKHCFVIPIHIVSDGTEVLAYLQGEGKYGDRAEYPLPGLLLLDLKMPVKTGFEALEWIRGQKGLQHLTKVVLSSSDDQKDVARAYELGTTTYFVKSPQLQDVMQYLRMS